MNLTIKAFVTGDNGFFYREEHEWRNLSAESATLVSDSLVELATAAIELAEHGAGSLTCELSQQLDDQPQQSTVIRNFSHPDMVKMQRMFSRKVDDLLQHFEARKAAKK